MTAALGPFSFERVRRAAEQVRQRLLRAAAALNSANIPYAVVGDHAAALWVSRVDESAVRMRLAGHREWQMPGMRKAGTRSLIALFRPLPGALPRSGYRPALRGLVNGQPAPLSSSFVRSPFPTGFPAGPSGALHRRTLGAAADRDTSSIRPGGGCMRHNPHETAGTRPLIGLFRPLPGALPRSGYRPALRGLVNG
jgi:hypothetical protein